MNQAFYVRFYYPRGNQFERHVWIVKDRAELDRHIAEYQDAYSALRLEAVRFLCNTPDEASGIEL
jgi:hypothetical protein